MGLSPIKIAIAALIALAGAAAEGRAQPLVGNLKALDKGLDRQAIQGRQAGRILGQRQPGQQAAQPLTLAGQERLLPRGDGAGGRGVHRYAGHPEEIGLRLGADVCRCEEGERTQERTQKHQAHCIAVPTGVPASALSEAG